MRGTAELGKGAYDAGTLIGGGIQSLVNRDSSYLANTQTFSKYAEPGYAPGVFKAFDAQYQTGKQAGLGSAASFGLALNVTAAELLGLKDAVDVIGGNDCLTGENFNSVQLVEHGWGGAIKMLAAGYAAQGVLGYSVGTRALNGK